MAQSLLLIGLGDAADVLLKRVQAHARAGRHERILGNFEAGIDLPCQLPGQRVEDRVHLPHLSASGDRLAHAQVRHVHQLRLRHNSAAIGQVAAHNDRIGVQRLGQLDRTGPRRVKALWQPQVIERVDAVRAAHGGESC